MLGKSRHQCLDGMARRERREDLIQIAITRERHPRYRQAQQIEEGNCKATAGPVHSP